jgi:hypothetical protein
MAFACTILVLSAPAARPPEHPFAARRSDLPSRMINEEVFEGTSATLGLL